VYELVLADDVVRHIGSIGCGWERRVQSAADRLLRLAYYLSMLVHLPQAQSSV
jgi:hypothetical protein